MPSVCVYEFFMADHDDPWLYAAQPIWNWQQTELGQWIMSNSHDPRYQIDVDTHRMGYRVRIMADLTDNELLYYKLKWS